MSVPQAKAERLFLPWVTTVYSHTNKSPEVGDWNQKFKLNRWIALKISEESCEFEFVMICIWILESIIKPRNQARKKETSNKTIQGTVRVSNTNRVCHVWCKFLDGSFQINNLAFNYILFQHQKRLPKWRQFFVKYSLKKPGFLSRSSNFIFLTIRFSSTKFHQHVVQTRIK